MRSHESQEHNVSNAETKPKTAYATKKQNCTTHPQETRKTPWCSYTYATHPAHCVAAEKFVLTQEWQTLHWRVSIRTKLIAQDRWHDKEHRQEPAKPSQKQSLDLESLEITHPQPANEAEGKPNCN